MQIRVGRLINARLERQGAGQLHPPPVGVRQAVSRLVHARQEPVAEQPQDLLGLAAQARFFAAHRPGGNQR